MSRTAPANGARGEVCRELGGRQRRLCLTLGALAEMEDAFAAQGAQALTARLASPSASDLILILAILLRGGGETVDEAQIARFRASDAASAAIAAFEAAGAP